TGARIGARDTDTAAARGARVTAGGKVSVDASSTLDAVADSSAGVYAGATAVGAVTAQARRSTPVSAFVGDRTSLTAGGNVSVEAGNNTAQTFAKAANAAGAAIGFALPTSTVVVSGPTTADLGHDV